MALTQDNLKSRLHYNAETGIFTWIATTSYKRKHVLGKPAGYRHSSGYILINIDKKLYKAHRLAWLYVYGHFPELSIDHIDRDGCNNALSNLRLATHSQNMMNTKARSDSTSGHKNIWLDKRRNRWLVVITAAKKKRQFGPYKTIDEAIKNRDAKLRQLHGEFARVA